LDSAGMRKRRVGVTARSRQIVGKQASGSLQVVTEMAASLELRTPMGTAAKAAIRVRMEAWRQRRGSQSAERNPMANWPERQRARAVNPREGGALYARMRRCLILRQGVNPLRPPAPFPFCLSIPNGGSLSRVRKPRKKRAPLTDSLRSETPTEIRERGRMGGGCISPPVGRPRGVAAEPPKIQRFEQLHEKVQAPLNGLRQQGSFICGPA